MFFTFAGSLVTLVVCMLFGVIGRKKHIFTDESDCVLSSLLINFTLPAMVFMSMFRPFSRTLLLEGGITILIISTVFLSGLGLGKLLSLIIPSNCNEKCIWQFSIMFPNVIYMGFPVIQSVFGDEGMLYAAMVSVAFNIMVFSLGIHLFRSDKSQETMGKFHLKQFLFTPAFIAVFIGLLFFVTEIRLPAPMERGIHLIGNMTTPIAMLLIGSLIVKAIGNAGFFTLIKDWRVYPIVIVRLLLIPVAVYLVLNIFIDNPIMLGTIVTLAAMPTATLTVIFSKQYGGDSTMALKTIVLSNILCLLTIPFLSLFLQ